VATRDARMRGLGAGLGAHAVGDAPLRVSACRASRPRAVVRFRRRAVQLQVGVSTPRFVRLRSVSRGGVRVYAAATCDRARHPSRGDHEPAPGRSRSSRPIRRSLRPSPYTCGVDERPRPRRRQRPGRPCRRPDPAALICHAPSPTIPIRRPVLPTRCSTAAPCHPQRIRVETHVRRRALRAATVLDYR
jgi:hypothetical protein